MLGPVFWDIPQTCLHQGCSLLRTRQGCTLTQAVLTRACVLQGTLTEGPALTLTRTLPTRWVLSPEAMFFLKESSQTSLHALEGHTLLLWGRVRNHRG